MTAGQLKLARTTGTRHAPFTDADYFLEVAVGPESGSGGRAVQSATVMAAPVDLI